MTFGLLTPLALGFLALVAGPILVHLVRQRPSQKTAFGAMMLLARLQKRMRRRRQFQDLLLMLLRALLVMLVVLSVARPEFRWAGVPEDLGQSGTVVVVLDNSLSMDHVWDGEESLFQEARAQATALVRDLPEGVQVGAVVIGGDARRLVSDLTHDRGAVAAALSETVQTQSHTDLAGGLREARRMLNGEGGDVVVFLDEAGEASVLAAAEEISLLSSQGGALIPHPIRPSSPANVVVMSASYGAGPEGGTVRMVLFNFGADSVEVPCTVHLPDETQITTFVSIEPESSAEASVTVPSVAKGGVGLVKIDDGVLGEDDVFAFHLPRIGASRVLVVDGDPGPTPVASEVYFLERALAPWGVSASNRGGVIPDVTSSAGVSTLDIDVHRVVFLANLADPAPLAGLLVDFVRKGGGLVIGLGDNVTADRYNSTLSALLPASLRKPRSLVSVGEEGIATNLPDTALPLFRPFTRGGLIGFQRAKWHRIFTLEPYSDSDSIQTLLSLEGGVPLLIERQVGKGRVVLLAGTFDLGWSNLPLQSVYMPLVQRLVNYLGGESSAGGERLNGTVGQPVALSLPTAAADIHVTGPDGPVSAHITSGSLTFTPRKIGAYSIQTPGAPPLAWVAVNSDRGESDVRSGPELIDVAAQTVPEQFLHRMSLGPWLLLAALILAVLQSILAWRLGSRREEEVIDVAA